MTYLITIALLFVVFVIVIVVLEQKKKVKERQQLLDSWGKPTEKFRNFDIINKFVTQVANGYHLTGQTLIDIDIERLFAFIDRTQTTIGQQYLFANILSPGNDIDILEKRKTNSEHFIRNPDLRNKARFILYDHEKKSTGRVADFFTADGHVGEKKYNAFFLSLSVLAITALFTFWIYRPIAIFMLVMFGINLMVHLVMRYINSEKLKAIRQVYQLTRMVDKLFLLDISVNPVDAKNGRSRFSGFRKVYRMLDFGIPSDDLSTLIFYLFDLIKSFFLFEVHLLRFCNDEIQFNKPALLAMFRYVGEVEIALSTASIKQDVSIRHCTPVFTDSRIIGFENIVHPLVVDCVPNTLQAENVNVFLTGSNMSGKSTFLRTVLINTILAQSLYLCFADRCILPFVRVFSSIKISDKLENESSYYFEEVTLIREMIENKSPSSKNLYIIDEIFKGTNTAERIALSTSVLQHLGSGNDIVVASSHDIELINILTNEFELYHFSEIIHKERLVFDHLIKPGGVDTVNAIRIAELQGFPAEVITGAKSFICKANKKNQSASS